MRKMSKIDDDDNLRKVYQRYETLLFKAANSIKEENVYSYKAEFSKRADEATVVFKQRLKRYVDKAIPETAVSSAAKSTLENAGVFYETANVKYTTYVQMVSKLTASAEQFKDRIQARIDEDRLNGVTTTVADLKQYISAELKSGVGIAVTYANGTRMPTDKYAEMLARTARTETHNLAMVCKAVDDGNDLVECSTEASTCDVCAMYQGRIYSVSGNTPGYPSLYETAFKHGYSIIHPNCRHQFFPYNPKFHTAEERQRLEENTRKPFTEGSGQSEAMRTEYAKTQTRMRLWNKEMNEFAEMQRFYKQHGEQAPYKNLGSFRRAYRSEKDSIAYAKSHYARRDLRQFEDFKNTVGKENMPQTLAEFQGIKYNKDKQEYVSIQLRVSDEKIRRKLGTDELPLKIQADKQGKHIKGHKNFTDNKSYLAVSTVEDGISLSQEVVNNYSGTGKLIYNTNKENIKEKVETDKVIGYVFSKQFNNWVSTKAVTIHYSKSGTHIVPTIIDGENVK